MLTTSRFPFFEMGEAGGGEQRRIVAYLDGLQAKVNALREMQPQKKN